MPRGSLLLLKAWVTKTVKSPDSCQKRLSYSSHHIWCLSISISHLFFYPRSHHSLTAAASDMWSFLCALLYSFFTAVSIATSSLAALFSQPSEPFWREVLDQERSFFHLPSNSQRIQCLRVSKTKQRCRNRVVRWHEWAHTLRVALINTDPTNHSLASMLHQYASFHFCHRHKKLDQPFAQSLLKRWEVELKQSFRTPSLSPIFKPRPQGYPMMPGSFPDDHYDEQVQCKDLQTENQPSCMSDAVPPPTTITPGANSDDQHSRPSSTRRGSGRGRRLAKWQFIPYNLRLADEILHTVVISKLKESDSQPGYIYILQRPEDSEYLKIGYTTQHPDTRLEEWRRSCLSPYERLYASELLTNVKRVESLIHADLRPVRYSESFCKHNRDCKHQHSEWFKVSFDKAKAAVDHWATWMMTLEPYENSLLRAKYVQHMFCEDGAIIDEGAKLFLDDSDGKNWVEHAQVLKNTKKDDAGSSPHQSSLTSPQVPSNQGEQPPSTPNPAHLTSGSRTSSLSSTTSTTSLTFSPISTASTTSPVSDVSPTATSPDLLSRPTKRLLFPPKGRSLSPTPTSPGHEAVGEAPPLSPSPSYIGDMDVDDPPIPLRSSTRGKRQALDPPLPDRDSTTSARQRPAPDRATDLRTRERRISFAPSNTISGRKSAHASTRNHRTSSSPCLLTTNARKLAASYNRRVVSSPAVLTTHVQDYERAQGANGSDMEDHEMSREHDEAEDSAGPTIPYTDSSESDASFEEMDESDSDEDNSESGYMDNEDRDGYGGSDGNTSDRDEGYASEDDEDDDASNDADNSDDNDDGYNDDE
jgi:hypothetical protein